MTSNPLRWHGGKSYLADWIISQMPPHTLYREPFFGGGAVLFRKPCEGIGEAVNERNARLAAEQRLALTREAWRHRSISVPGFGNSTRFANLTDADIDAAIVAHEKTKETSNG